MKGVGIERVASNIHKFIAHDLSTRSLKRTIARGPVCSIELGSKLSAGADGVLLESQMRI